MRTVIGLSVGVLLLVGCSVETGAEDSTENVAQSEDEIRWGADSAKLYPSVVKLQGTLGTCTGTAFRATDDVGSSQAVMTAAHCILGTQFNDLRVYKNQLGATIQIQDVNFPQTQAAFNVTEITLYSSDVAILRLDRPVPFSSPMATRQTSTNTPMTVVGYGFGGNGTAPTGVARAGQMWLSGYEQRGSTFLMISNHGNYGTTNSLCPGDSGGPALVDGHLVGVANSVNALACISNTVSRWEDTYTKRTWINTVYNNYTNRHVSCGYARTHYLTTSGLLTPAFRSDGSGCLDERFGNRYFRPSYSATTWGTQDQWCRNAGQALASSGHIQLARRINGTNTHLDTNDANELVWTSEVIDNERAYAIRLGSGQKEVHYKNEWLGGVCVRTGVASTRGWGTYPNQPQ